jgi:hypothetical protein
VLILAQVPRIRTIKVSDVGDSGDEVLPLHTKSALPPQSNRAVMTWIHIMNSSHGLMSPGMGERNSAPDRDVTGKLTTSDIENYPKYESWPLGDRPRSQGLSVETLTDAQRTPISLATL